MLKNLFLYSIFAVFLFKGPTAYASEPRVRELGALIKLDIEDLIKISVASKKNETIKEAPSVISVIAKDEIRRFGAKNLTDLLNRIPSFQTYGSHFINGNAFSSRGQSNQHYTNRTLILINGRPIKDSVSGGWNIALTKMFPVSAIQNLEIIRGPGSVLYGSNAFSSIINIVTIKAEQHKSTETSLSYGSHNTTSAEMNHSATYNKIKSYSAFKTTNSDGWKEGYTAENTFGNMSTENSGYAGYTSFDYNNLSINVFHSKYDNDHYTASNVLPAQNETSRHSFIDVGYKQSLPHDWDMNINATYNLALSQALNTNHSNDLILETSVTGPISNKTNALIGTTFEHQNGRFAGVTSYQTHLFGAYGQIDYNPYDDLKLVFGVQYNKPQNSKKDFSPRFAAIYDINQDWTIKALYGEAFRTASALEAFIDFPPFLVGDSSAKPEKIATKEINLLYENNGFSTSLNYYHSRITDQIGRTSNPDGGLLVTNLDEVIFQGLEFEGKAKLFDNWNILGSFTWQENEDSNDVKDSTFTPNIMAKFGVSYDSFQGWSIGLFDSYYGEPTQIRDVNASVNEVNKEPEDYHWLTLNADVNLNKVLGLYGIPETTLSLFGENLIGNDIYYPEFNRQNVNSFPIYGGGRAVFGRVTVKF